MSESMLLNGRYRVTRILKGPTNEFEDFGNYVYLCVDEATGKKVVVKTNENIGSWYEAEIMESVSDHPSVPGIVEKFAIDGQEYFAMEWVDGEILQRYLEVRRNLSPRKANELLMQILQVIAYLHSKNVYHNDLYRNFLVGPAGVFLIDFGIADEGVDKEADLRCVRRVVGFFSELDEPCKLALEIQAMRLGEIANLLKRLQGWQGHE